jgi:hypothetical protein
MLKHLVDTWPLLGQMRTGADGTVSRPGVNARVY